MKSTLLLGKNYHSYLISFALFERNKKVFLLDDLEKRNLESAFFFDFERVLLETWGLDCNISPLLNLDSYLSPRQYCLVYDGTHLNLGGSPGQNYNEVLRKIPGYFGPDPLKTKGAREKFDDLFNLFSENFGVKLFRFVDKPNFNFEVVWKLMPEELQKKFLIFKENSMKEKYKFFNIFLQGIYQNKFSQIRSDFELLFIFLHILSPRFEIDIKKFEEDLARFFKRKGGEVISNPEISFQIKGKEAIGVSQKGKESLKLEKVFLSSGKFLGVPITLESPSNYTSLNFKLDLKISELIDFNFFISSSNRVGGINPLTLIKFEKDFLVGEVLIPYSKGSKEVFEEAQALQILLRDLEMIVGSLPSYDSKYKGIYTQRFWYHDKEERPDNFKLDWSFIEKPVKNLKIYHPCKSGPLGQLSMLAQIKDERGHIL